MLRSLAFAVVIGSVAAGCSSPSGASSSWSFGPSLPPASGEVSAAPSPSVVRSAPPSAPSSPGASASAGASGSPAAGASGSPAIDVTPLAIGTRTGTEIEFEPDEVSVPANSRVSVAFENLGSLPHNLTFAAPIGVATSPVVDPGASETIVFDAPAPGDYAFTCTLHPGMEGTLTVEPAS